MKNILFILVLFIFLLTPSFQASAQSTHSGETTSIAFDTGGLPQWVQDLRRWDIITFGLFPFTLFAVTFTTDMIRWNNANAMDFSSAGRRYAPWPLKSAGAFEMSSYEFGRSVLIAAGFSMTIALIDLIITVVKRNSERRRVDSRSSGSVTIKRIPAQGEDLPSLDAPDDAHPPDDAE